MVKKYLTSILLFLSIYGSSQENKNKFVVNGFFAFSTNKVTNTYRFSPSNQENNNNSSFGGITIGYFLTNSFSIGISGRLSKIISDVEGNNAPYFYKSKGDESNSSAGLFARYNQSLKNNKFAFFYNLKGEYEFRRSHYSHIQTNPYGIYVFERKDEQQGVRFSMSPGVMYFINSKFSVESSIGSIYCSSIKRRNNNDKFIYKDSGFGIDFSVTSLYLGFSYYFGGKKS